MDYRKYVFTHCVYGLLVFILVGCGSSTKEQPKSVLDPPPQEVSPPADKEPEPEPEPEPTPEDVREALNTQVNQYITGTTSWFTEQQIACSTATNDQHELCEPVEVTFTDGNFDAQRVDNKQTILVLDAGMQLQSVLRYRSRIKAAYRYDVAAQKFVEDNPKVSISGVGKKILSELDQFTFTAPNSDEQIPGFIPAAWLTDLATVYTNKVPDDIFDYDTSLPHVTHGTLVLGYLAEHNPRAEFVLVDTASFLPFQQNTDLVCSKQANSLLARMQGVADAFTSEVIQKHDVEFVNFSGGYTQQILQQAYSKHCDGQLNANDGKAILLALQPIYDALFNTADVFGIQAGIRWVSEDSEALDALDYSHRVRVASYSSVSEDTPLDKSGEMQWRKVLAEYASHFEGHEFIDLFINFGIKGFNSGVTNSTPKMTSDVFGMRYAPDWELHSSWAAPVATSYAVYLQSILLEEDETWQFSPSQLKTLMVPPLCYEHGQDTDIVLEFIRQSGECRIQDPLKFKANELNRLGYFELGE